MVGWDGPDDVLRLLIGGWSLSRQIDDKADMTGVAVFEAGTDGFIYYHESGILRLADGGSFDAERRYSYAARPNGFAVHFFETPPRLFHEILLTADHADWFGEAKHMCGDDIYDSRYVFAADGSFTLSHHVQGPRKNYLSRTLFKRL